MKDKEARFINPFTDFGFKKIFGEEYNKDLLIDFLNSILSLESPIADVTYGSQEKHPVTIEDRKSIVDIYCESQDGSKFIVEMQKTKHLYFKDRSLLYASYPIVQQAKKGKWNYKLSPVYVIAVLDFEYENESGSDKYVHDVRLIDVVSNKVFHDKLRLLYIEMPKFRKKLADLKTNEDRWLYFLKNLPDMEEIPTELSGEIFEKAFEQAEIANYTKSEYDAYFASLDYYWCNYADMDTARQEGLEEGRKEGRKEGIKEGRKEGIKEGRNEERKLQEEKIKQIEEKHSNQLKEKENLLQEKDYVIQEKDNKLVQVAQLLLKNGMTKEQIFAQTGLKI